MKLTNLVEAEKKVPADVEKAIIRTINDAMVYAKGKFDGDSMERAQLERIRKNGRRSVAEYFGNLRFSTDGSVYRARDGEEDDDHPEPIKKAFDDMGKMFEAKAKANGLKAFKGGFAKPLPKGRIRISIGGSEKGHTPFEIDYAL